MVARPDGAVDDAYDTPGIAEAPRASGTTLLALVAAFGILGLLAGCAVATVVDEEHDEDESWNQCYPRPYYLVPCLPIAKIKER